MIILLDVVVGLVATALIAGWLIAGGQSSLWLLTVLLSLVIGGLHYWCVSRSVSRTAWSCCLYQVLLGVVATAGFGDHLRIVVEMSLSGSFLTATAFLGHWLGSRTPEAD